MANVAARTSCLVIVPSCRNSSSASPGTRGCSAASGAAMQSTAKVLKAGTSCAQLSATPSKRCSFSPPIAASTVIFDAPKPRSVRNRAIRAGVSAPVVRIRRRASGWMKAIICSTGRPCTVSVSTSASDQPIRAAASWNADSCG